MLKNTDNKTTINKAFAWQDKISQASNILLITHKNPDADALGAMSAITQYLDRKGKKYTAFLNDNIPDKLFYLKNINKIVFDKAKIDDHFDLVIALDCSSLPYTGIEKEILQLKEEGVFLLNIDHHITQSEHADYCLVDSGAASTTVVLYNFFKELNINIDKDMATALLTGIIGDTGNFVNNATDDESLAIAAELMKISGKYNFIVNNLWKIKEEKFFWFWSQVLSRLTKNDKLKVIYSVILESDRKDVGDESIDGISNFFCDMGEGDIAMVLKERSNGEVKVSLRSINKDVEVLPIAEWFGGGGHRNAAGFTIKGRLEREDNFWQVV